MMNGNIHEERCYGYEDQKRKIAIVCLILKWIRSQNSSTKVVFDANIKKF